MGSGKCILFNYITYNAYIKYPSLLCVSLLRHWIVHTASAKHCYGQLYLVCRIDKHSGE